MAEANNNKGKRPRQGRLPNTDNRMKDIEDLAYQYAAIRDARIKLLNKEIPLKQALLDKMKEHKLPTYRYDELTVMVKVKEETVKVIVDRPKTSKASKDKE